MRRNGLLLAAGAMAALLPARARADELTGTYEGNVVETRHAVTVERKGDLAVFRVERAVKNRGSQPEEIQLTFALPMAGVADRFEVYTGGAWRDGVLMEAGAAAKRYEALTGSGKPRRSGPALLAWESAGFLSISAYPVVVNGTVRLRYRLKAPLCYADGWMITDYPMTSGDGLLADVEVTTAGARARVVDEPGLHALIGDGVAESCAGLGNGVDRASERRFVIWPERVHGPAAARLGHYRIDDAHHLVRLEVSVPRIIEAAPARARVVFVVDASRSVGDAGLKTQLELIQGYLDHVPDAEVELVLYRRWATRLFGRFVPARQVAARLRKVAPNRLVPGNGSELERGVALAARLVAAGASGAPARIVAFTDDRVRDSFDVAAAARGLGPAPADAVAHVVLIPPAGGTYAWERQDDHRFFPIARARGGVVAAFAGGGGGAAAARDAMLGLVRPLSIDHVAVSFPGADQASVPDQLIGGDGVRQMLVTDAAPDGAAIDGQLWSRPWHVSLAPDRSLSRELPLLAFGHEVESLIPEGDRATLAMVAGVISPDTSMLARDPRAPPTSHVVQGLIGRSTTCGCTIGCSTRCGIRCGIAGHGTAGSEPDRDAMLRALLADRVAMCAGSTGSAMDGVSVAIETTSQEIVDVHADASTPSMAACVEEEAWRVWLPPVFDRSSGRYRATY